MNLYSGIEDAACELYLRALRDIPEIAYQGPDDGVLFGVVQRGAATIMLKHVGIDPLPNPQWHPWAGTPTSMSPIRMR